VHGLAAQSGGTLRIISEAGAGTTVEIWLPTTSRNADDEPKKAAPAPVETTEPRRILLVDDDFLVMAGTAAMLEDLGHRVVEASSGARALAALRSGAKVDMVITDYAMPEMTGAQLAREIRQSWPHLPIIMATGYAELPDEEAASFRILNKPFLQNDLAQQISEVSKQNANLVFLDAARRG
jgi:CheY-like chemotaxis protein